MKKEEKIGTKNDSGKLRYDLVTGSCYKGIAEVLTMGSKKYEDNNWMVIDNAVDRYFAALMRHLIEWKEKWDTGCFPVDDESDLSHMKHVLTNAMFLLHFEEERDGK